MSFTPNPEYCELLKQNAVYHMRVRSGSWSYKSTDYQQLQQALLQFELKLSSYEIIKTAEHLFPRVGG